MSTLRPAELSTALVRRYKRRLLPIVDPAFQWKYTLIIMVLGVGTASVMGTLLYGAQRANTRLLDLSGDTRLQEQVAMGDRWFLYYLVGIIIVMALCLGAWGLIVTHRISGPVYLVARYCDVLAQGHYPDVRPLRRHDELQAFFNAFCGAVSNMRERDLAVLRQLEVAATQAKMALHATDTATLRRALEDAATALEAHRRAVGLALGQGEGVTVE